MDTNFQQGYEYFRKNAGAFVGAVDGADFGTEEGKQISAGACSARHGVDTSLYRDYATDNNASVISSGRISDRFFYCVANAAASVIE